MGRTKTTQALDDREEAGAPASEPHALSILVDARIKSGQISLDGAADSMGVVPAYLRSLINGHRKWARVPPEKLRKLADLLAIKPRLNVYAMAGVIEPDDWLSGSITDVMRDQYEAMQRDARISPFLPAREVWQKLSLETRRLIVMMYLELLQLRTIAATEEHAAKMRASAEAMFPKRDGDEKEGLVF